MNATTKVTGAWREAPATQSVCRMLAAAGHRALFVGGCVRNALLGAPVRDIDIATDARPEQVMTLARAAGMKPVPTGIEHGTVTVVSGHVPHEVTTFRRDVDSDGRHATVRFSGDVADDARRRDFTMNALYAECDGRVIDPLGGLGDLQRRHVRFIEDPHERIREDYLRILRFFRFHAWYGDPAGGLDPEGLAAVAAHREGLAGLSRERVGSELLKLLSAPDPAPSVAAMRSAGVLGMVLPGAGDRVLGPLVNLEGLAGTAPDPLRRLAALGGEDCATRLRLSRAEARTLEVLRDGIAGAEGAAELGYRHGAVTGRDILLLRAAIFETPLPGGAAEALARGAAARFPLRAADLMPGLTGPALGARLKALEARWIASDFSLGKRELLGE